MMLYRRRQPLRRMVRPPMDMAQLAIAIRWTAAEAEAARLAPDFTKLLDEVKHDDETVSTDDV